MNRHDPLSALSPEADATPAPAAEKPKARKKLPPLLREVAGVPDSTLAFLDANGEAARRPAAEIRAEFTTFCEQHPEYAEWRRAWAAYHANVQLQRQGLTTVPVAFPTERKPRPVVIAQLPAPVQTSAPALPMALQRARQRAALFAALST
jgi:hypothetical protein